MTSTRRPAQQRIAEVATANGWTAVTSHAGLVVEYRRNSRRVTVYSGLNGQTLSATYQTGSYGGKNVNGADKTGQVIAQLAR